jgi:hypothetical protein
MIRLTDEQRKQLMAVLEGQQRGSLVAAQTVLLLDEGRDTRFVAKATFSTPEEVAEIAALFDAGGVSGIANYKPR